MASLKALTQRLADQGVLDSSGGASRPSGQVN